MTRTITISALSAFAAFAAAAALPASAGDVQGDAYPCEELWQMRNQVFKSAGYCFKAPRAIAAFGNAGCLYDDEKSVPLSDNDRDFMRQIRLSERRQGC